MVSSRHGPGRSRPSLALVLLATLLVILWLAGGASVENAAGQIVARAAAWATIVITVLFVRRPRVEHARGTALFLLGAITLCVMQLIPLPPDMWRSLPGRTAFAETLVSPPGLWRPLSLVPGATVNALLSLVVPLAVLLLATALHEEQRRRLPAVILMVVALSLLAGLFQFTGARIVNPLMNGIPGTVDGLIANRNHYALFLSFGLLIAPAWALGAWALGNGDRSRSHAPVALGLILLLVLTILASGSRAGILLGALALVLGLTLSWRDVKAALRRYPRWVLPALGIGLVALLAILVLASVAADRAVSLDRLVNEDAGQDMRGRGLPIVLTLIRTYFPFGTGMGSFDPVFRMQEPFALLQLTYFNHAHDDFLEIVLTGGLPGLLLLAAALGWWGWRSVAAWRAAPEHVLPRLGSSMLLLILIASAVDYPARTPLIMAMATMAATWLGAARTGAWGKAPLPPSGRHL